MCPRNSLGNSNSSSKGNSGSSSSQGRDIKQKADKLAAREGKRLYRRMVTALIRGARNETSDPWELAREAARLWPAYRRMAEDGLGKS